MNHSILVIGLAEDRLRWCPCGAVTRQPYGLCRECNALAAWRCETARTCRRAATTWTRAGTVKARLLAEVASLLQITSKEVEN
jgi:ribosomal protein L40E